MSEPLDLEPIKARLAALALADGPIFPKAEWQREMEALVAEVERLRVVAARLWRGLHAEWCSTDWPHGEGICSKMPPSLIPPGLLLELEDPEEWA